MPFFSTRICKCGSSDAATDSEAGCAVHSRGEPREVLAWVTGDASGRRRRAAVGPRTGLWRRDRAQQARARTIGARPAPQKVWTPTNGAGRVGSGRPRHVGSDARLRIRALTLRALGAGPAAAGLHGGARRPSAEIYISTRSPRQVNDAGPDAAGPQFGPHRAERRTRLQGCALVRCRGVI